MTPEQFAQIAYEEYANRLSKTSTHVPTWAELDDYPKRAWVAAAQAVKANVMANFTHVGETHA